MRKAGYLFVIVAIIALSGGLKAEPPAKAERKTSSSIIESANGWLYVNREWVHPDGYKFVNNKVVRTTAKTGKAYPKPPGKLALDNPTKLTPPAKSAVVRPAPEKTAAEKAAEARRKNLTPSAAPQTGTHL
jgi:hypothetical protein